MTYEDSYKMAKDKLQKQIDIDNIRNIMKKKLFLIKQAIFTIIMEK